MAYPVATSALTITLFECDHPDIGVSSIDCTGALFALFFYLYRTIWASIIMDLAACITEILMAQLFVSSWDCLQGYYIFSY